MLWKADCSSGASECGWGTGVAQHCSAIKFAAPANFLTLTIPFLKLEILKIRKICFFEATWLIRFWKF